MPLIIVRNDITKMQVDAIVNSANPKPLIGSGVDADIYQNAGNELLNARKAIGDIACGEVAITSGYDLDVKYIIHTVGPFASDHQGQKQLASCYLNSLEIAKEYHCKSIAFPLISTGNLNFPKYLALKIASEVITQFLQNNEMQVYMVVFDKQTFEISKELFESISSYIDENYVESKLAGSNFLLGTSSRFYDVKEEEEIFDYCTFSQVEPSINKDLDDVLNNLDAGFSETLLKLIDKTGKKDSEIYKKANVDRKLFSKIRNNINYQPSKPTAIAFAFALELDLDETIDFIARAGFTLSHSNKFDVIVEYFLKNHNHDVFELNEVLFAFDQPLIGM